MIMAVVVVIAVEVKTETEAAAAREVTVPAAEVPLHTHRCVNIRDPNHGRGLALMTRVYV